MLDKDVPALVGIVPRRSLWPLIQNQRWYHIPLKSAPRNATKIKYLAFYFPAAFGEELKYQVRYYANVEKIGILKRIALFPEEKNHPRKNEQYLKIHLGNIEELPAPILSKRWRRIVHIPTTLNKLLTACEINDLYHTSLLEEKMYKALKQRRIFPERQLYVRLKNLIYCLDFCIFCKKANIDLECDGEKYHVLPEAVAKDRTRNNQLTSFGWQILRFSGSEINKQLKKCLSIIDKTIFSLYGLKN